MKATASLYLTLALLTVVVGGCGGEEESGGSGAGEAQQTAPAPITTASLSKAQFVNRANSICERLDEEQAVALTEYAEERPDQSEEELLPGAIEEIFIPTKETQIAKLRELGAPRGEQKRVEAIVRAMERALEDLQDAPQSEPEPSDGFFNRSTARARDLANAYELDECAV